MAQYFEIHPVNPQPRLIRQAVEIIRRGGVVAYPTDSSYALGCHIGDKQAMERILRIRPGQKADIVASGIPSAASMTYDSKRNRLVIPMNDWNAIAIVELGAPGR